MDRMDTKANGSDEWSEPVAKRRRTSSARLSDIEIPTEFNAFNSQHHDHEHDHLHDHHSLIDRERAISIVASSRLGGQSVAPFLARHIPEQYNPLGKVDPLNTQSAKKPNSKFCYRHRPDLKCRRQADEPSMDQLQRVGFIASQCPTETNRSI